MTTIATKEELNTHRTTARIVGVIYLLGFVVGIAGSQLILSIISAPDHLSILSAASMTLGIASLLWLMAVVGDAAHGVLMFPILKQHSERMAVGYLAARIADAIFIAVMVLFLLLQIPLGSEFLKAAGTDASYLQVLSTISVRASDYAYFMGMCALGLSGLMLNYVFYKAKLVPRWIAIWGLAGYAIIFAGMASEFLGSGLGLVSSYAGGLWEVFIGVWLIVKGFNSSAFVSQTTSRASATIASNSAQPLVPNLDSAKA